MARLVRGMHNLRELPAGTVFKSVESGRLYLVQGKRGHINNRTYFIRFGPSINGWGTGETSQTDSQELNYYMDGEIIHEAH